MSQQLGALQTRTTDTHYRHTLQTRTTDTHYRHALQTHTTDTHYRHALQTHTTDTTDTHYRHTIQTHTTDTQYRHIPLHFSHNERTPVQIHQQHTQTCSNSSTMAADSSTGVTTDAVDTVVCAPDDGWQYHPKHVEQFPYINKLCDVASFWDILTMRVP
jgi:hypothetical protein